VSNQSFFRKKSVEQILTDLHENEINDGHALSKSLNVRDLTFLGIAAIIGASIFSAIGKASSEGGPAVSLLFIFTAISCMFTAFCYARFASTVPISGSAYTYAYTSFGEIVAWILGWNLLLEYAISNVAVAISWSEYFVDLLEHVFGMHVPEYLTMDYLTASRSYEKANALLQQGQLLGNIDTSLHKGYHAWSNAPQLFGFHLIGNVPALVITALITYLVYIGIKESKQTNNILVILKLLVIALVVGVGVFYVKPANWSPFAPNGIRGVLNSVAAVCFAYIGFDSVSTTAEECQNPQRDIPKAMMYALVVCTVLYVLVTLVLTGIVKYDLLTGVDDPLSYMFETVGLNHVAGIVAASAVVALTSALLVYQLGQPRIWMTMARDGLLPQAFARVHPRYQTPSFATIITGFVVAIPALFMNLTEVIDLSSIGTLFAFALVCGGVLILDKDPNNAQHSKFKIPYLNAKYITGGLLLISIVVVQYNYPTYWDELFNNLFSGNKKGDAWIMLSFFALWILIAVLAYRHNLSLIPILGLIVNLYLMTQMGATNWERFLYWCLLGFGIYFGYSYRKSRLHKA
jgi:basic amino acid/polyamine antiporter, APA family